MDGRGFRGTHFSIATPCFEQSGHCKEIGKRGAWPCLPKLNTLRSFRAPPVSVATVDRSRAPLHVLSMDNDARMIRLPSTKHWRFAWECRPVGRPQARGNRIHGERSPPPYRSPVRNRFPQGRWTDYAGGAGDVNKCGSKILIASCYLIDPKSGFLHPGRNEGGFYPRSTWWVRVRLYAGRRLGVRDQFPRFDKGRIRFHRPRKMHL
jgi:hypothetical protein